MRFVPTLLIFVLLGTTSGQLPFPTADRTSPAVSVQAIPHGGIQPQAVADAAGVIHLVYFKGNAAAGDLYYVRLSPQGAVSEPIRVNSVAGAAIASGSVRGAQIALGRRGRVHVAWNGSTPIEANGGQHIPMWYARLKTDGSAFEKQRALTTWTSGLDGGGAIAADRLGRVIVVWHATGSKAGEADRTVYLAKSSNDGAAFAREERATTAPVGSCGCCGMRALIDRAGNLQILYRAATEAIQRDATWLTVPRLGTARPPVRLHPWRLESCPMTTFALAEGSAGILAAWETQQQIHSTTLDPASGVASAPLAVPGTASRKHPSLAINAAGDRLLAWTEGTAWNRGGTLAWRLTDRAGTELSSAAGAGPVPVWGLVAAVALPDGSFVIFR
jgi:hypothetical protein